MFIERADGTIYDPEEKERKMKEKEEELRDRMYEKHMAKVLNNACRNRTPYTPTQMH